MIFSSVIFLFLFLPLTFLCYLLSPERYKNFVLFLLSLVFYSWGVGYHVTLLLVSIALNYVLGRTIDCLGSRRMSKLVLAAGVGLNLMLLASFKYLNFIVYNFNEILLLFHVPALQTNMADCPLGLSFFTFQSLSYIIDVYRKAVPAEKRILNLGLYISLFPKLIAGPIVRYPDIVDQIRERSVRWKDIPAGIERFIIGLGKKVLIADTLAPIVNQIFDIPAVHLTAAISWLGIACYTLQIYFDFSGYTDMAIGLGYLFGFRIQENFNYPYVSKSIQEFWKRWHISLSAWFRDYLYLPLGGNRRGKLRTYHNLLLVFLLCGLWHGASWNFVIWGLFHGGFLVIERLGLSTWLQRQWLPLRHFYAIGVVMTGWVFFRSDNLSHAVDYIAAMYGFGKGTALAYPFEMFFDMELKLAMAAGIIASVPVLRVFGFAGISDPIAMPLIENPFRESVISTLKASVLTLVLLVSILSIGSSSYSPFIYFKF